MHSIRAKITSITIAAIITSILAVSWVSYTTLQQEHARRSVEMMNLLAQDTGSNLERYFESVEQSVGLTCNIAVDTLDGVTLSEYNGLNPEQQTDQQRQALDDYLHAYAESLRLTFASASDRTYNAAAYYCCFTTQVSTGEPGFYYSKVGKAGFGREMPYDAQRLRVSDARDVWYFTPIRRGQPCWVGPYQSEKQNDTWIYSYLAPVYKSGQVVAVLGMDIPVETLVAQVRNVKVYQTGFACLLDSEGHVVYHPSIPFGEEMAFVMWGDGLTIDSSGEELLRYSADGQARQMSFTTLSNGMKLIVTAPEEEINASWLQMARMSLLISLAMLVFFVGLTMFVVGVITAPLQRLTAASRRLADADYDVELGQGSRDEVGELTRAFSKMRDQLKQYIEDLNRRIYTDDLTGLPNMRYFFRLAEQERSKILEQGGRPAMLYFNLVGLKHFNRQNGFSEGDKLICAIAQVLSRHYSGHCLSRFNRDHFAAVTDEAGMEAELQQVFQECAEANGGRSLPIRVGIYQNSLEQVNVSIACDRAKYAGDQHRASFVSGFYYFDAAMLRQLENLRYVINHLDQALREHWIRVDYQPIIRAVNGRVCDEEALSRWIDPVRGMMSPADFIPTLENSRLIYKLDLYVLDEILAKMKDRRQAGIQVVPHSLNLSRVDFDTCDIVEEVRRRVDEAGVGRDMVTIEVTESIMGRDFAFMKSQIQRFQALGFRVWMDDFGSGYSALDVLQDIHFDVIKFDMRFMHRFGEGNENKVILTELIRMAVGLGIETVCEGVETQEQVDFLREVGCTKLQGFYFSAALPFAELVERSRQGRLFAYENPQESPYFQSIGKLNLYDLGVVMGESDNAFDDTSYIMPMGVLEIQEGSARFIRTNQSYRDFLKQHFGFDLAERTDGYNTTPVRLGASFMKMVRQCSETGGHAYLDEQMPDGSIVHSFVRQLGRNPVNGADAVAVAVLSITSAAEGASYAGIARALAADYYNIYYVDLTNDRFIEYSSPVGGEELAVERHGEQFFEASRRDAQQRIHKDDLGPFLSRFTKENILRTLDEQGAFTAAYRLMDTGSPLFVVMKITRMQPGGDHIIVGISVTDREQGASE